MRARKAELLTTTAPTGPHHGEGRFLSAGRRLPPSQECGCSHPEGGPVMLPVHRIPPSLSQNAPGLPLLGGRLRMSGEAAATAAEPGGVSLRPQFWLRWALSHDSGPVASAPLLGFSSAGWARHSGLRNTHWAGQTDTLFIVSHDDDMGFFLLISCQQLSHLESILSAPHQPCFSLGTWHLSGRSLQLPESSPASGGQVI